MKGERCRPLPEASCRLRTALPVDLHGLVLLNTECNCNDALMKKKKNQHILFCLLASSATWFLGFPSFWNASLVLRPMQKRMNGNDWFKKPFFMHMEGWGLFAVVVSTVLISGKVTLNTTCYFGSWGIRRCRQVGVLSKASIYHPENKMP